MSGLVEFAVMKKKYPQWYKKLGLKHVTGFLTADEKRRLKKLAGAADKSLARYVTRLMQNHIREEDEKRAAEERKKEGTGNGEKSGRK